MTRDQIEKITRQLYCFSQQVVVLVSNEVDSENNPILKWTVKGVYDEQIAKWYEEAAYEEAAMANIANVESNGQYEAAERRGTMQGIEINEINELNAVIQFMKKRFGAK
jgi:hypothetical protein